MPHFYLFAGPNGAGKTTIALKVLPSLSCQKFLNADLIAHGLSPFNNEAAARQSSELLLEKANELAEAGFDFGIETTLAARTYLSKLEIWRQKGYRFHLFYLWLPSAEMSIARVASRVRAGGHHIPETTIRRRFEIGRQNFANLYRPQADFWTVFDNSQPHCRVIARGDRENQTILDNRIWEAIHAK